MKLIYFVADFPIFAFALAMLAIAFGLIFLGATVLDVSDPISLPMGLLMIMAGVAMIRWVIASLMRPVPDPNNFMPAVMPPSAPGARPLPDVEVIPLLQIEDHSDGN